ILTLILTYIDIEENINKNEVILSEYDINILLWAVLLHDIAKHVVLNENLGEVFEMVLKSYDKIHPFKSGAVSLKIFHKNNLFKIKEEEGNNKYEGNCNSKLENIIDDCYDLLINSAELRYSKRK